jgi:hypothetical protein
LCGLQGGTAGFNPNMDYNQFTHGITEGATSFVTWSTMAHEIGHILGLVHTCDCQAMMYDPACGLPNCGGEETCFNSSNERLLCGFLNSRGRGRLNTVDYPPGTVGTGGADNNWCLLDKPPVLYQNGSFTEVDVSVVCEGDQATFSVLSSTNGVTPTWTFDDKIAVSSATGSQVTVPVANSGFTSYSVSFEYNRQQVDYQSTVYVGIPDQVRSPIITPNYNPYSYPPTVTYNLGFYPAAGATSYSYSYTISILGTNSYSGSGTTDDPSIVVMNLPENACINLTIDAINDCGSTQSQYSFCLGTGSPVNSRLESRGIPKINEPELYPNPANRNLTIRNFEALEIIIHDSSGRLILKRELGTVGTHQISIDNIPNGIYQIMMISLNNTFTKKVLIQHD